MSSSQSSDLTLCEECEEVRGLWGEGGSMAIAFAVVVILPSGFDNIWHHVPMLALHPTWNRFQYVLAFNHSFLNFIYLHIFMFTITR